MFEDFFQHLNAYIFAILNLLVKRERDLDQIKLIFVELSKTLIIVLH